MLQKLLAFHRRLPGLAPIVMIATVIIGGISYVGANTTKVDTEIGCPVTDTITYRSATEQTKVSIFIKCRGSNELYIIRTVGDGPEPTVNSVTLCNVKQTWLFGDESMTEVKTCRLPS